MMYYKWCVCMFLALLLPTSSISARLHEKWQTTSRKIVVDPSGKGGFRLIQEAIDSVPSNNKRWVQISIKSGIYREKVTIPSDKPYIYLRGEGTKETVITWNGHGAIDATATFTSLADNIIARGIKFVNSYNYPPKSNPNPVDKGVAALIKGDKSAFYNCGFYGLQDTLWDVQGRHYFKSCTIEGSVDFIFGDGQSLYEGCTLVVNAGALRGTRGYITAQGREGPQDSSGFVFKQCNIVGNGEAFLGRPWRYYARVLFYDTYMSNIVVPQGWEAGESIGHEYDNPGQLMLSEYNSRGAGAKSSERVKWSKKMSEGEANKLASVSFIDKEGWITQALSIIS